MSPHRILRCQSCRANTVVGGARRENAQGLDLKEPEERETPDFNVRLGRERVLSNDSCSVRAGRGQVCLGLELVIELQRRGIAK